jgi:hypothetical protein
MEKSKENNGIKQWLIDNSWVLLVMLFSVAVAFTNLKAAVRANASDIRHNTEAIAGYPSEDWFNLKFETIEKQIRDLENK